MACYERSYSGERRTYGLRVQLTPSEGAELEAAAGLVGAPSLSVYVRELLFRRSAAVVAGTRRNPEAAALMRELNAGGKQPQPDRPTPQRDRRLARLGRATRGPCPLPARSRAAHRGAGAGACAVSPRIG